MPATVRTRPEVEFDSGVRWTAGPSASASCDRDRSSRRPPRIHVGTYHGNGKAMPAAPGAGSAGPRDAIQRLPSSVQMSRAAGCDRTYAFSAPRRSGSRGPGHRRRRVPPRVSGPPDLRGKTDAERGIVRRKISAVSIHDGTSVDICRYIAATSGYGPSGSSRSGPRPAPAQCRASTTLES